MNSRSTSLWIFAFVALFSLAHAQDPDRRAQAEKLVNELKYQHGEVTLEDGLAKISIPAEFNFLGREDARVVLEKLWGNPPSDDILGMLLPANTTPLSEKCWAVTISYSADGYVKDDEAGKINYDDLLKKMKKEVGTANKERVKEGYPAIDLIGWAAPPHYDGQSHKLYWAKELRFGDDREHTLNYSIRILGRRGVLVLNAIASMNQLAEIEQNTPRILGMVNFNDGHRYADFDPKADKVAAYGIAALVAGGLATKMGFFKLIWVFILAAKKFIIIGVIALAGVARKLFSRNKTAP